MEKLIEVIKLAKPEADIDDMLSSKDLYGYGLIDSLDILVLVDEINAAYGIEIGGADLRREDFRTLDNIYAMVKRCGGA